MAFYGGPATLASATPHNIDGTLRHLWVAVMANCVSRTGERRNHSRDVTPPVFAAIHKQMSCVQLAGAEGADAESRNVLVRTAHGGATAVLYDRGAEDEQVGALMGIGQRSAARGLLPRSRPTMAKLAHELV